MRITMPARQLFCVGLVSGVQRQTFVGTAPSERLKNFFTGDRGAFLSLRVDIQGIANWIQGIGDFSSISESLQL